MSILSYIKKHSVISSILVIVAIIIAILASRNGGSITPTETNTTAKRVTLVAVEDYRSGNDFVSTTGLVTSRGQVDLKSQFSAPVREVYGPIGREVEQGEVIVELENADVLAQLEQAEASLDLANSQFENSGISKASSRSSAIDKVRDSYVKGYDVVISQIDPLLFNHDGNGGRLTSLIVDTKLSNRISMTRIDLITIFKKWKSASDKLDESSSDSEINSALVYSIQNLNIIDKLLGDISQVLNDSAVYSSGDFSTFLSTWKGVVSGTRSTISGTISATIASQLAFNSSNTAYNSSSQAQVALASAGLRNLEAQYAKTIIRSPITGRIASLPLDVGELVSPGQIIATVIGEQGLEVKAYTSGDDINKIKVGARVLVNGIDVGEVLSVAPSISSANRKVEVKIALDDATTTQTLTVGETVQVKIKAEVESQNLENKSSLYKLPIQDIKIEPGEAYVLTVDSDNKVTKNPVILGEVDGDFVQVIQGLTSGMSIISPVYELDLGESVITE